MRRWSSPWIVGIVGVLSLSALFYALRTDATKPQPAAKTDPGVTTATRTEAKSVAKPNNEPAAVATASGKVSPKAAAEAPAVPNFVDLVQAVKPAVVSIRVKSDVTPQVLSGDGGGPSPFEGSPLERFFQPFTPRGRGEQAPRQHFFAQAQGSGFFISADGYVVTNNHVVANAVQLQVVTDDGRVLDAKMIGADPKTDLALLRAEGQNFSFVTLAEEPTKIGEWVIAMGNPFGLGGTVTAGIVSAQGRDIGAGPYDDFLQIDAAVNRGNSGGPTFNMSGRVIGVNTAIYSPSGGSIGIAFAIPAKTVKAVVAQLKERGYVERGWIGVHVQPVTKEIATSLGLKKEEGALIASTQSGGPAERAGLKAGDVIIAVNGIKIAAARDLAREVAGVPPNTNATVEYLRDGKPQTAQVTIGQMKDDSRPRALAQPDGKAQNNRLGLTLAPAARVMGIGEAGLAVLRVEPGGKAAEAGITAGDIILQLGGKQVSSPDEFVQALQDAARQNKQHLLALVMRNDRQMFIALPTTG